MTTNTYKPAYKKHMVLAADPGFYAVDWTFDPKDKTPPQTRLEPVVAWLVSIYEGRGIADTLTIASPVIHEARSSFFEGAVLYPDGRVVIPGKREFKTLQDYQAHKLADWHNNYTTFMTKQDELGFDGLKKEAERIAVEEQEHA